MLNSYLTAIYIEKSLSDEEIEKTEALKAWDWKLRQLCRERIKNDTAETFKQSELIGL